MKSCSKCKIIRPTADFWKSARYISGRLSRCKECMTEQHRMWKSKTSRQEYYRLYELRRPNKEKRRVLRKERAKKDRVRLYNITWEYYHILLNEQGNSCAICKNKESTFSTRLFIDHCHSTGKVRGLLCMKCNSGLGLFKDSTINLESAKNYLMKAYIE